jgi:excisionase family DNA binding protein
MNNFLTVTEAAEFLLVKPSTLYGWVHERKIPFRKHGSKLVFSYQDLQAWSKAQEVAPVSLDCHAINKSRSLKNEQPPKPLTARKGG